MRNRESKDQLVMEIAKELDKKIQEDEQQNLDTQKRIQRSEALYKRWKFCCRYAGYVGVKFEEIWKSAQTEQLYLSKMRRELNG